MSKFLTDSERIDAQKNLQSVSKDIKQFRNIVNEQLDQLSDRVFQASETIGKPMLICELDPGTVDPDPPPVGQIFDCVRSENGFIFNNGQTVDLVCGSAVPISLPWVGTDGGRAPNASGGGVGLSSSTGQNDVQFSVSIGLENQYYFTVPNIEGTLTVQFSWGNSNDDSLCFYEVTFNCIAEDDLQHEGGTVELIGWGTNSVFGNDGRTIVVNNLNTSGPGSFKDALEQSGTRQVVLTVAGVAPVPVGIVIGSGNISIIGSTAPGTGFKAQATPGNNQFVVKTNSSDVFMENVGLYQNNDSTGNVNNRDTMQISTNSYRVVLSQCTFMWGADEILHIFHSQNQLGEITVQFCLIAEGLSQTGHASGEHSKGMLVGNHITGVSAHHNWFTRNARRNPRILGDMVQIAQNVTVANCDERFRGIAIGDNNTNGPARYDVLKNLVIGDDGPLDGALVYPPQSFNAGNASAYMEGNIGPGRTNSSQPEIDFFGDFSGNPPSNLNVSPTPFMPSSLEMCTHDDVQDPAFIEYMRGCVGAHSWNRHPNDQRAIDIGPDSVGCTSTAIQLYL